MQRNSLNHPPSLRAFLAAGCDLTAADVWLEGLVNVLYDDVLLLPPRERARQAEVARTAVEVYFEHAGDELDSKWWRAAQLALSTAEVLEDPELAERARAALPAELRAEGERLHDLRRRPHPIVITDPAASFDASHWTCENCGQSHDKGEAEGFVVTAREGWSKLDYEITYCAACIRLAADALDGGQR